MKVTGDSKYKREFRPQSWLQTLNTNSTWLRKFAVQPLSMHKLLHIHSSARTLALATAYNTLGKELQSAIKEDYEAQKIRILAERVNMKNLDRAFEALSNPSH